MNVDHQIDAICKKHDINLGTIGDHNGEAGDRVRSAIREALNTEPEQEYFARLPRYSAKGRRLRS